VERLRQRKGKKSTDKRYQHFMSLRSKLVDDETKL